MKVIGIIPARMAASRFPGKPLHPILGMPMIEHVYRRAALLDVYTGLHLATCDEEIKEFGEEKGWSVIMTSDKHTRCLDRVAEAASKCGEELSGSDVIVCIQGDEPMLHPEMILASIKPLQEDEDIPCTVLGMHIIDEDQFRNPDTVKIIHDLKGDVLYTSRSPVPYCKEFSPELEARRIYGIFAFRWSFLQAYTEMPESPLELKEACDSNRILDNGYKQRVAPFEHVPSFSVDSPSDITLVEDHIRQDPYWDKYQSA